MSQIVNTRNGQIEGNQASAENPVVVFRGIPFAAPPTGPNRWLPPQAAPDWVGVRPAVDFGAEAPQNPSPLDAMLGGGAETPMRDEDCLYLNVWTPAADTGKRPVMVWIHGGGFTIGAGSQAIYDAQYLARDGDVVVVTINYRMGPLGFMNLAAITNGAIPATGNEGLLDQVCALEWVRDNISAFGGDAGNVTIFGESAGGMSCGGLLAMPAAKGLFHKAIPQSGACHTAISLATGRDVAATVLELLDVDPADVDALMALPESALTGVQQSLSAIAAERGLPGMSFQPVIDGTVLPTLPIEAVRSGSAAGVAVFAGSTAEEWKLFAGMAPAAELDEATLETMAGSMFNGDAAAGVAAYRAQLEGAEKSATPADILTAMSTDRVFRMPALALLEAQAAYDSRVYAYRFDWPSALMGGAMGACHAVELGFVFGTHDKNGAGNFFGVGEAAQQLSAVTREAWTNFARTGNPSGGGVPAIAPYSAEERATLILDEDVRVENKPSESTRGLWLESAIGSL